jgi:hypothetical protein
LSKISLSGNASGTGTFTIASPNGNTDRTLTLPDNTGTVVSTGSTAVVSQAMMASNVAGNGPAFSATAASNQTGISNSTFTKVIFATENFDTNNCFSSSRFTPDVAGYYQVNSTLDLGSSTIGAGLIRIYKNGSNALYGAGILGSSLSELYISTSGLVYCNGTTDYIEIFVYMSTTSNVVYGGSFFQGFLARAA